MTRRIAVVGGGPAGLACAWKLQQQGSAVTVFEAKTNLGAQGSGVVIQSAGLQALCQLGVLELVLNHGQKLSGIDGYTDSSEQVKVISADYTKLWGDFRFALGVHRSVIWSAFYQRALEHGVAVKSGVKVVGFRRDNQGKQRLIDQRGVELGQYDLLIDSSGAGSMLRDYANKPSTGESLLAGSYWSTLTIPDDLNISRSRMTVYTGQDNRGVGIMPIGVDTKLGESKVSVFFNIDTRTHASLDQGSFIRWRERMLMQWVHLSPLIENLTHHEQLYFARFHHHTVKTPFAKDLVLIGDAAHCSSPQLGQGINMSLIDAVVLLESLGTFSDHNKAIAHYAKVRRLHVWFYQSLARFLAPMYQSDNPSGLWLRDNAMRFLTHYSLVSGLTAHVLSGHMFLPKLK